MRKFCAPYKPLVIGLLSALFWATAAQAANVSVQPVIIQGSNITTSTKYTVYDQESYDAGGTYLNPGYFTDLKVNNTIAAKINLDHSTFQADWYRYDFLIFVKYYNHVQAQDSFGIDTLSVTFDPESRTTFAEKGILTFKNGYFVDMWVLDIIHYDASGNISHHSQAEDWLELELRIDFERYYDFDRTETPTITSVLESGGLISVYWSYPTDTTTTPESFDLEWTFVDNYKADGTEKDSIAYDFSSYGIRVNVPVEQGGNYQLEHVFPRGWLIFRIRAVGRIGAEPKQRQEGVWSLEELSDTVSVTSLPAHFFEIEQGHEADKNWRYMVTYIEGGKHKGVITYHDGTLRQRQQVTRLSEEGKVLVGETIYDFEGRPTVQILPSPVYNAGTSSYFGRVQYYENLNRNPLGDPYSWRDYDLDGASMTSIVSPLDSSSGAGRYYSSHNPSTSGMDGYIPDAKEYPFVRTEFMPDNTGRVRMQGGVGPDHQPTDALPDDSLHATKYYYTVPMQEILDGMFGTEVGYARFYRKMVAIDPNGQGTATYTDPQGRTIATTLAGTPPANLVELENVDEPTTISFDLTSFNDTINGHSLVSSISHVVTKDTTPHLFTYSLDPGRMQDSCSGVSFCYDCVYDFEFIIQDLNGDTLAYHSDILGPYNQIDSLCNDSTGYVPNGFQTQLDTFVAFADTLDEGQYQITKRLTVNEVSLLAYADRYLDDFICLKTEEDFFPGTGY